MKQAVFLLEWSAVFCTALGGLLASLNYHPEGPYLLNVGAFLFLIMSICIWKKWSLIAINALMLLIYTGGLIYEYLTR